MHRHGPSHISPSELDGVCDGLEEEFRRGVLVVGIVIVLVLKHGNERTNVSGMPMMSESTRHNVEAGDIREGQDDEKDSDRRYAFLPLPIKSGTNGDVYDHERHAS